MKKLMKISWAGLCILALCLALAPPGQAFDIMEKFSIGGVMAGTPQYQWVDGDENKGRGAFAFQPEFSFHPNDSNEFFAKFGFAVGNGLNGVSKFNLASWAADLEDDVTNINGRNRDYLLTAWYKYTFNFSESHTLGLTGGIIDATDYVDENAYANDEYTQFMNEALVNGPNGFYPSYDGGASVEWQIGNFDITGVYMNVGEEDDGNNYNYYAGQIGYRLNIGLGEGNYRLIVDTTSKDFRDNDDEDDERLLSATLSFDQQLGDIFGAFFRFTWEDDEADIDYDQLYSGGLNITGKWYGREQDNFGIGYAYLNGEDDFDYSQVFEVYWRVSFNDYLAATADFQYMKDEFDTDEDEIEGTIGSIRIAGEF